MDLEPFLGVYLEVFLAGAIFDDGVAVGYGKNIVFSRGSKFSLLIMILILEIAGLWSFS